MTRITQRRCRRGFAVSDVVAVLCCVVVAGSLLVSLTGATRDLSQAQVCANNLRQLFTGMTAYVNQYNSYPPNGPYPQYMASETISGISTGGWDPNIGFIMTHGLGLVPPRTDTAGHFKWYGAAYADLPDVCKCPAMSAGLLDMSNPELADTKIGEATPLETVLYQYALSYQTSGTIRAACRVVTPATKYTSGTGGRNPSVADPTGGMWSARQMDNAQRGVPGVYVYQHDKSVAADEPSNTGEYFCWVQAINPSEVDQPSRVFYMADSRDYRPQPKSSSYHYPPAGCYNGWWAGYGNRVFQGSRHYGYGNVMYLDGTVSRDGQTHNAMFNMDYDSTTGQVRSSQWRVSVFDAEVKVANIRWQGSVMPQFMVKGWEAFFDGNGMKAH